MSDFEENLKAVFREVFDDQSLELSDHLQAQDVEGWDSIAHITLIMAIEEAFKVQFLTREVMSFKNVGDMKECLWRKLH
jgi:acyl carrier protein